MPGNTDAIHIAEYPNGHTLGTLFCYHNEQRKRSAMLAELLAVVVDQRPLYLSIRMFLLLVRRGIYDTSDLSYYFEVFSTY